MYLKRLEMVGFKSFAEPTRLEFGPGIMAIVGPNGCGKSNISDAIRWVLGEQSARALRGAKMEDCIFNGTDAHKALGMAEVSITLADCESALGLDYNEVTVTRRVHRSGEGEYLINKTPCRLKDIQRLFMDTGIGTNSYSLMEQGRIDRVLSSRPEDRRAVFEEASGITKFKADKKEALRKLEQTEENLKRLADIIAEVRTRIISLQRQAGKARRYQALQRQLRAIDLRCARERLAAFDERIQALELRRASLQEREEAADAGVRAAESAADAARERMAALDRELETLRERLAQTRALWEHTRDSIAVNRDRAREFAALADRDAREADQARAQAEEVRRTMAASNAERAAAIAAREESERRAAAGNAALRESEQRLETVQRQLHDLRNEALEIDRRIAQRQRDLADLDARERTAAFRREKLSAERIELQRAIEQFAARDAELRRRIAAAGAEVETAEADRRLADEAVKESDRRAGRLRQTLADLRAEAAARRARIEMLERQEAKAEGFPGGARMLLDPPEGFEMDRARLRGPLADYLEIDPEYRAAAEAVLRPWLDSLVVADAGAARDALRALERRAQGAARLVPDIEKAAAPTDGPGEPLLAHVRIAPQARNAALLLLGNVRVVGCAEEIPAELPPGLVIVTRTGAVFRGDGPSEFWMADEAAPNPLARRRQLNDWRAEAETLALKSGETEREIAETQSGAEKARATRDAAAARVEEARRRLALAEGERRALERDAQTAAQRAETVAFEIESLSREGAGGEERRARILEETDAARRRQEEIRAAQAQLTEAVREAEQRRTRALAEATEARIEFAERRNRVEQLDQQAVAQRRRVEELETLLRERSAGAENYRRRSVELESETAEAEKRLEPLAAEVRDGEARIESARQDRESRQAEVAAHEAAVKERRTELDAIRRERGQIEIEAAETRARRQALLERAGAEYRVSADDIANAPEPDWSEVGGAPADREALETLVAELRAKLESLGAVNLVAIEECQEHEKRYEFLTREQDDLVKAKQHLLDMIRRINQTTTAMFRETFEKVNENFRIMFERLFGGGSAKLVLVDEEDVLECGIEIIARPPGKKLQSVSLLSGGERTMTAVALLFALYMVKPSPFCLLDELDAALDDANIGRFVTVVQDFVKNSQFIVITHNRQTIAAANTLFGVTMEKHGISKIVSVRFNREGRPETAATPELQPA